MAKPLSIISSTRLPATDGVSTQSASIRDRARFQRKIQTAIDQDCGTSKSWAIQYERTNAGTPFGSSLITKHSNGVSARKEWVSGEDFYVSVSLTAWSRIYGEELYDHSIDPNELTNLATREQFNRLKLHLRQLLRDKLNDSINDTPTQNISIRLHSYNEQTTD